MNNRTIYPDSATFYKEAALRIALQIQKCPRSVVGLSTGRTTGGIHRALVEIIQQQQIDCSHVIFVGVDEVTNVDREYAGACYKMLRVEVLDSLNIPDEQFLILPTRSEDWERTCMEFSQKLEEIGGIDLLELGLGENGHLGFNQPGTPSHSDVRISEMTPELEERIRRETQTPKNIWLGGATLGIKNIMHARHILLVANGQNKADIVRKILTGPVDIEVPASILQLHPHCDYVFDADAAQFIL